MAEYFSVKMLIAAVTYAIVGNIILAVSLFFIDKMTPGDMWKEIVTEKNLPFAIITAAMTIAIGHIVAAAIHG